MLDFLSTSLFDCITKTSATNVHNYNSSYSRYRTNKKLWKISLKVKNMMMRYYKNLQYSSYGIKYYLKNWKSTLNLAESLCLSGY